MKASREPAVVSKGSVTHYSWGEGCDGWHLLASNALSVIEERVPAGAGEVRHYHRSAEQFFYVLSGEATIELDGCTHRIEPSRGLHVPAKSVHKLENRADTDLRFLVISTPPSHGDRVTV